MVFTNSLISSLSFQMHTARARGSLLDSTQTEQMLQSVQNMSAKFPEDRIQNVTVEIGRLL
jgi:hypothetical protein